MQSAEAAKSNGIYGDFRGGVPTHQTAGQILGRWPPNLLLCHAPGCCKGEAEGEWACVEGCPVAAMEAQAGAGQARFFPQFEADADDGIGVAPYLCPKASRAEREAGCEALPGRTGAEATHREEGTAAMDSPRTGAGRTAGEVKNWHPTVKPVGVMRWLCRLLVAPGGRVLDPFMGSGTTGIAAVLEGFDFTGIEMDEGHMRIAEARIAHHTGKRAEEPPPPPAGAPGEQMSLFGFPR
jgi:site-specific DNA-methyltransferase (adenine-specific)